MFLLIIFIIIEIFLYINEYSLMSLSLVKAYGIFKQNDDKINNILYIKNNSIRINGMLLMLVTIIHNYNSALFNKIFIKYFGFDGIIYCSIFLTVFYLYLDSVLKTFGVIRAENIMGTTGITIKYLDKYLSPFSYIIEKISIVTLKIMGINNTTTQTINPIDQLRDSIKFYSSKLSNNQKNIFSKLASVYGNTITSIMIHKKDVHSISLDNTMSTFIREITNISNRFIPIWQENQENIMGYIDCFKILQSIVDKTLVYNMDDIAAKLLSSYIVNPIYLYKSMTLSNFINRMNEYSGLVFVVDEDGSIMGIINNESIVQGIFTEFHDNYTFLLKKEGKGYVISGNTYITTINKKLLWNLPEDNVTILGLLLYHEDLEDTIDEWVIVDKYRIKRLISNGNPKDMVLYMEKISRDNSVALLKNE